MSLFNHLKRDQRKYSYSQCGEDIIIYFIFNTLKIKKPSYIDIGAHDPFFLSNTALLYDLGSNGVNIEANPNAYAKFEKYRKRDINLNIGISDIEGVMDFYILSSPTMSTFFVDEAEKLVAENGFSIVDIKKVTTKTLSTVIKNFCSNKFPDFLSLDVEGLEMNILKDIDYENNYPKVICCETISYSETGNGVKDYHLIDFLKEMGYMVYADTYINTIFVREDIWRKKK